MTSSIPPYHPQGTETIAEIPAHFLVDGYLKLRADGTWLFRGEKIEHRGLQKFLSRQLRRTEEGQYWVVNGPQRGLVELEDAPFVVTRILFAGEDPATAEMTACLNDDSQEPLLADSLLMSKEGVLYTRVKRGQAGAAEAQDHLARISGNALIDLESLFVEMDDGSIALQHQGNTYRLERDHIKETHTG